MWPFYIFLPTSLMTWYPWRQKLVMSSVQFSSFQSLSHVRLFETPWIAARQASLSITNSQSSLRLTSIELCLIEPQLLVPSTLSVLIKYLSGWLCQSICVWMEWISMNKWPPFMILSHVGTVLTGNESSFIRSTLFPWRRNIFYSSEVMFLFKVPTFPFSF